MDAIECLQKAVDFVEEDLCGRWDADTVASKACMSSFQFQRLFSVVCGVSLGEYIRNRRLTLAAQDITQSDAKIIDIALRYGYETPESFSRAFSRFHGISPLMARSQPESIHTFARLSIRSVLGGSMTMEDLKKRGYTILENGPIYYTQNMDQTAQWFQDVLGWYAGIDQRDEDSNGIYGCLMPLPAEVHALAPVPFHGFHLFYGVPTSQLVGLIRVDNVQNLHDHVLQSGWTQVSSITKQHWGGQECTVTTVDGCQLKFFQLE